jgi:hypothetical protein
MCGHVVEIVAMGQNPLQAVSSSFHHRSMGKDTSPIRGRTFHKNKKKGSEGGWNTTDNGLRRIRTENTGSKRRMEKGA